ncbi:MAG: hypothetical protein ACOCU5_00245 [Bacillota bacterium]
MNKKESLVRARTLIQRGRYTKHTIRTKAPRFETVDAIDVIRLDGAEWLPYYDKTRDQLVYGYHEKKEAGHVFHYLAFLAFDYHYAARSAFEWFERSPLSFKDLD